MEYPMSLNSPTLYGFIHNWLFLLLKWEGARRVGRKEVKVPIC